MKKRTRALALILSLLFVLPVGVHTVFAENAVYASVSFDGLTAGDALKTADGFASVPTYSSVMAEGSGKYARIPFVGSYVSAKDSPTGSEVLTGNAGDALILSHSALKAGKGFTLEIDYRPHMGAEAGASVDAQILSYGFTAPNGDQKTSTAAMTLYRINLSTGALTACGTVVSGAKGMVLDEWNTLQLVYHPANGHYEIYINGELYARQSAPKMMSAINYMNCRDVLVGADQIAVATCVKSATGYTATDLGGDGNYIDVDNVRLVESREARITLDGKETYVNLDIGLDLAQKDKKLLYAEITHPGKATVYTTEEKPEIVEGSVVNTRYIGLEQIRDVDVLRNAGVIGLRYLTALNKNDYDGMKADARIKSYRIGTAILPADAVGTNGITAELLASTPYLDVPVNEGSWYNYKYSSSTYTFAGSIVSIKEANSNRAFIGVGYVKITMQDGTTLTVFSENRKADAAREIMSFASYKEIATNYFLTDAEKSTISGYMEKAVGSMKGLNVLALGDSLFGGTNGYPQRTQWVNKLGNDFGWNLTNLGTSSMTVSLTKYNNDPSRGNKNSMYDWLFNNKNDFRWGSTSKHTSPHPFYSCGDISGDPNDVDLIIFEGGCNDYGTAISAPLGTVDSRDPGTFLGAWNLITERLLAQYPNATIVFLTSWRFNGSQSREEDTLTSREYSDSVIRLYEANYANNDRIALIDAGDPAVSGVDMTDSEWRNKFSTDSYHLKDTGMAVMASNMVPLLWEIVKNK